MYTSLGSLPSGFYQSTRYQSTQRLIAGGSFDKADQPCAMTMDYGNPLSDEKQPLLTHATQGSGSGRDGSSCDNEEPSGKHCCSTMSTKRKACYSVLLVLAVLLALVALLGIPYAMAAIYRWVIDTVRTKKPLFLQRHLGTHD